MACAHNNPPSHNYCSQCGEATDHIRCLCGFNCGSNDLFCGRCSIRLDSIADNDTKTTNNPADGRIHLGDLIAAVKSDQQGRGGNNAVSQDDIARLIAQASQEKN